MKLTDRELADLATLEPRDRQGCLPEALMVRAVSGELSAVEREAAADHLGSCSECAGEHRLLLSLGEWAGRAGQRDAGGAGVVQRAWPAVALRTAAAVAALGLLSWNVSLQRSNHALSATQRAGPGALGAQDGASRVRAAELERELSKALQPELNPVIAELEPLDATRGTAASDQARTLLVPTATRFVNLVLMAGPGSERRDHEVSVADVAGAVVWSGHGLRRGPDGTFTLALPARLLAEGEYRVRVTGPPGSGPDGTERFAFRVRRP